MKNKKCLAQFRMSPKDSLAGPDFKVVFAKTSIIDSGFEVNFERRTIENNQNGNNLQPVKPIFRTLFAALRLGTAIAVRCFLHVPNRKIICLQLFVTTSPLAFLQVRCQDGISPHQALPAELLFSGAITSGDRWFFKSRIDVGRSR